MWIVLIVCIMSIAFLVSKQHSIVEYLQNFFRRSSKEDDFVNIDDEVSDDIKDIEEIQKQPKKVETSQKQELKDQAGKVLFQDRQESSIESALFNIQESKDEVKILKGDSFTKPKIEDGFHRMNKFEGEDDSIFKD